MQKPKIAKLVLLFCLFQPLMAWGQQEASAPGEQLTLEEAIALALRENHHIKIVELGVRKVEDELAAVRIFRLPAAHVYSVFSQQLVKQEANINNPLSNVIPGLGPFFSLSVPRRPTAIFGAQLLQPVSQQYRIGLTIEQIKLARELEREELRLRRQSTVETVKRTYYGIMQTQSGLESLREAIRLYRELDRVTGENVAHQVALKSDSLEVKTKLAKAEYEALTLDNQLATQKEQLNHLLGRDVRTEFRVSTVPRIDEAGIDLISARRQALEQRPEVRQSRLKSKQAEFDRRIKKSEYIPEVSVGLTYLSLRNFDEVIPKNFATLGVVVKWEIFDWGRKRHQLAEKDKTLEQAKYGVEEAESQVLIEVGDKFRRLQQSRQALVVAQLGQETAREAVRISANKYKLEAALLTDVLQTQAVLAEANHHFQQSLLGYWTAKAQFEQAIGAEQ
ncbi:MAG: TolC family protein [Blastocatellia bacterium]|nr:TolC family protein [Blastocatellia bacterium]